jgi:hypothetical protein
MLSHFHLDIFGGFIFIESCGSFLAWVLFHNFPPFLLLFSFATMRSFVTQRIQIEYIVNPMSLLCDDLM